MTADFESISLPAKILILLNAVSDSLQQKFNYVLNNLYIKLYFLHRASTVLLFKVADIQKCVSR